MRLRKLLVGLSCILVLSSLTGATMCSAGQTVKILTYEVLATEAMEEFQQEFEKATGVGIKWEFASEPEVWDKISMEMIARTGAYDVFPVPFSKIAEFVAADFLEPLDQYVQNKAHPVWLDMEDFVPGALGAMKVKGKLYALPFFMWEAILVYRKDIYEKVGIDQPPTTLTEFEEVVKKTTIDLDGDGKTDVYGFTGRGSVEPHSTQSLTFAYSYGGEFFDKDMKPTITTPQFVKGVDLYVRLLQNFGPPGAATHDWWDIQSLFLEGKVSNMIDATTEWSPMFENPEISKVVGKVGHALAPQEKRPGGYMYVCGWGIPVSSKNKDVAWEFIQWATSKGFQFRGAVTGKKGRVDVTSVPVIQTKELAKDYPYLVPHPMVEAMNTVHPDYFPRIPEYTEVMTAYLREIQKAIAGEVTTERALETASKKIYDIMKAAGYYR